MNDELKIMNEDWVNFYLGDAFKITYGKGLSTKELIQNGFPVFGANGIIGMYSEYKYEKEQVLISCRGAASGTINLSPPKCFITNNSLIIEADMPKYIDKYFLFYILQGTNRSKIITGTAQPQVTINNANKLIIKLAPLPIQRVIVKKIEQLFSSLDSGIADLTKAQEQLKIYRQAVLKKAFEGELTKEWRKSKENSRIFSLPTADELLEQIKEERQNHYNKQIETWKKAVKDWEENGKDGKKPGKPKAIKEFPPLADDELKDLPKLPKDWLWAKTGSICLKIQIGPFGTQLHKHDYTNTGVPIINPKHIKNQKIIPQIFISVEKAKSLQQYILKTNDVILGRRGEMGRTALITEKQNGWFCGTGSLFIRFGNQFRGELYSLILSEHRVVSYLNKRGSGTTMTNLNSTIINELPIQVISTQEQTEIVRQIESRLSVCDKVAQSIAESLEKSKALRQSILKKAFEGKLLSAAEIAECKQAKDYEPASVLLERIKAEKLEKELLKKKSTKKRKK